MSQIRTSTTHAMIPLSESELESMTVADMSHCGSMCDSCGNDTVYNPTSASVFDACTQECGKNIDDVYKTIDSYFPDKKSSSIIPPEERLSVDTNTTNIDNFTHKYKKVFQEYEKLPLVKNNVIKKIPVGTLTYDMPCRKILLDAIISILTVMEDRQSTGVK